MNEVDAGEDVPQKEEDEKTEILSEINHSDVLPLSASNATEDAEEHRGAQLFRSGFRNVAGIIIVLALALNDIGQSEYAQYGYSNINFQSYYFLSWITTVPLLLAYPLWISLEFVLVQLKRLFTCNRKYGAIETTSDEESPLSINDPDMHGSARNLEDVLHPEVKRKAADEGFLSYLKEQLYNNPNFSFTRYLLVSVMLAIFNLFSAWTWFVSLDLMPVAINGAIYRSTMVFVFILSILFLKEVIVFLKLVALGLCVAGVVVVGIGNYQSDDSAKNEVLGYVLVLVSSFLYACYEVGYRRWIGEANVHGILLINSMMGFVVLVGLWFLIPIFWATGVEPSVTFDYDILLFLLANAGFVVSYYLLYTFGMTATSPLYMNTTGLVGMPMAALADWLLKGKHFAPLTLGGMALVTLGVLAINVHVFCKKQYQRFAACMKERMWCMVSSNGTKPQLVTPTSTM